MNAAVGRSLDRVDGHDKVTGRARYAVEHQLSAALHGVLVRSTVARARIEQIDCSAALSVPGVRMVLTHENRPPLHHFIVDGVKPPITEMVIGEDLMPLDGPEIHYAGQHVALVVAETSEQAAQAAALVAMDVTVFSADIPDPSDPERMFAIARNAEPAVVSDVIEGAGSPLTHRRGDPALALAAPGAIVLDQIYTTPMEAHCTMETSGTLASWDGDRLLVYDSTQWTQGVQRGLARSFGIPLQDVVVVCDHVGGAFGCKAPLWAHTLLAAAAARACGQPVSLPLTRQQMFTSVGHRPPTFQRISMSTREDGALLGLRHDSVNLTSRTTDSIEACARSTSRVLYSCPNVSISHAVVDGDISPATWMRAPGECPGSFALETAIDEMAARLAIDPIELRLRNHADLNEAEDRPWSGKHLRECYVEGAARFGWERRTQQPGSMRDGRDLVGWGMATATYMGIKLFGSAGIRLDRLGHVVVNLASQDLGTGARTIFSQIAADALHVDVADLELRLGDSRMSRSWTAGGSAATASNGEALYRVGAALRAKLAELAGSTPGSPLLGLGAGEIDHDRGRVFAIAEPSRALSVGELLRLAGREHIEVGVDSQAGDGVLGDADATSFGAHFCEVRIDPGLPRVRVERVVSVMDIGRVINPKTASSQISGSVVMGLGMALTEEGLRGPDGRMVNDNLADYAVPVHADIGSIDVHFIESVDPTFNSLGARGAGEIGITGFAAAVGNAVYHATGLRFRTVPITPERLIAAGLPA